MKRILLLVLMFISFITPCAFATDGNVYENQQYKFRVTFPDSWQVSETKNSIIVEGNMPGGKLSVAVFTLDPKNKYKNVDELVNKFIEIMQEGLPNSILAEKNYLQISNNDAIQVVLQDKYTYHNSYIFIGRGYVFFISSAAPLNHLDTDRETVRKIISTFTFID